MLFFHRCTSASKGGDAASAHGAYRKRRAGYNLNWGRGLAAARATEHRSANRAQTLPRAALRFRSANSARRHRIGEKMRHIERPLALGAMLALSACATTSDVMRARVAKIPEAERSYVIGIFAVECVPDGSACGQTFNDISLHFRGVGNELWSVLDSQQGGFPGNNTVYDFTRPDTREKGYAFCVGLPAGGWYFDSYGYVNFAGGGSGYYLKDDAKFNLPFTLAPGEIVYVGKLELTLTHGKNVFRMNVTAPGDLVLSSDPDREIPAALAKCPAGVQDRTVRRAVLKAEMAHGNPLLRDADAR
jgi:hypothetical protein